MLAGYYRSVELPWTILEEDERRYRKILKRVLLAFLLSALLLPFLPVPELPREQAEELPPRLAQLLLERQPPVPPVKAPEPEFVKPEQEPLPKKAQPKKPEPVKSVEAARAKAERSGLLAFKDELTDLRTHSVSSKLARNPQVAVAPVSSNRPVERSLVTSKATTGSGGINTARLSRDTGGAGLAGRGTTQVTSPVAASGGGGSVQRGAAGKTSRSLEDVRLVFDRNKGAIYAIYNRALREDSTLQGKVVLKLTIAPSGQVIECQIVSSELRAPELERKLVARIKQFDFGAKQAETMVVTYPIDFLPS